MDYDIIEPTEEEASAIRNFLYKWYYKHDDRRNRELWICGEYDEEEVVAFDYYDFVFVTTPFGTSAGADFQYPEKNGHIRVLVDGVEVVRFDFATMKEVKNN